MRFVFFSLIALTLVGACGDDGAKGMKVRSTRGMDEKGEISAPPIESVEPTAEGAEQAAKVELAIAEAEYSTAAEDYNSKKSDASKTSLITASLKYGNAAMFGPGAPKEKYPLALKMYNEVLALDPKNAEASKNKQQIIDIYASMGREPPK